MQEYNCYCGTVPQNLGHLATLHLTEVASLLVHLVGLLRGGRRAELADQLNNLPKCELWLCQPDKPPRVTVHGNPNDDTSSSGSEDDAEQKDEPSKNGSVNNAIGNGATAKSNTPEPMDQDSDHEPDPGWTLVKSRRKK